MLDGGRTDRTQDDAAVVSDDIDFAAAAGVALDGLLRNGDASLSTPCSKRTRNVHAWQQLALRIGNSPRSVTWPVEASTLASENSNLPGPGRAFHRRARGGPSQRPVQCDPVPRSRMHDADYLAPTLTG